MNRFGDRLAKARVAAGLSRGQVAHLTRGAMSPIVLAAIEDYAETFEDSELTESELEMLLDLYRVNRSWLITGERDTPLAIPYEQLAVLPEREQIALMEFLEMR